jgi:hypothetical protein
LKCLRGGSRRAKQIAQSCSIYSDYPIALSVVDLIREPLTSAKTVKEGQTLTACGRPSDGALMDKHRFNDGDYSVIVKNRGSPPNSWKWEIYRAGRSNPIGQSPVFFHTVAAANKAGKAALKQLLNKLST